LHNMAADVFPDRQALALQKPLRDDELVLLER
jgi:hypothetical protein